ncbi:vitamin D 25-hydroxylase-like [Dermacentor andersoni]|uniref:vitamin D 25-hydroxylase-like n=1 Tax=Dermacentor andersoni TaxID=34620 RepID=UPI003B3B60EA
MALLSLAVALALVQRCERPPTTLPAGPRGVPLLGNLLSVGTTFHFRQCPRWAALYGTVFMVKLAGIKVVILNDYETVKKLVTRKELLHRSKDWALTSTTEGLSALNGKAWKENRRVCMQAMAELGFGKDVMWIRVQDEVQHLVETLAKCDGKPVPSRRLLAASVCNCVALYLFGQRHDLDDPRRRSVDRQVEAFFRAGASTPVEFLPAWLRRLARLLLPDCRSAFVERFAQQVTEFSRNQVAIAQKTQEGSRHRSFIDVYLREAQKRAACVDNSLTTSRLVGNVTDLLLGGTAASTLFLHWQLLNVAARADTLQVALQREIDAVVGRDRSPAWGDRTRLPLVMACVWETLRWKAATPLGIPRGAAEDVVVDGLLIPEGTTVMPNLWAVHMDPKVWKDPAKFDPTRFLPADGSALIVRPEHVIPFSIGKRSCPGEALAIVEMFLYTTHLLHAFRILPEEDQEGLLERVESLAARSNDLASVRLRFFRR